MHQLNVSIGVIIQDDMYVLQRRGADPKIGAAGKIGAFGGKVDPGETSVQAVCRELSEETSVSITEEQAKRVANYIVRSDHQLEQVEVHIEAFEVEIEKDESVSAYEGEVVKLSLDEARKSLDTMTPATRYYFEYVKGE